MTLQIDFHPIPELEQISSPEKLRAKGFMLIYPYPNPALGCNFTIRNDYGESVFDLSLNFETADGAKLFEEDVKLGEELNAGESLSVRQQFIVDYAGPNPKLPNQTTVKYTKWLHPAYLWQRSVLVSKSDPSKTADQKNPYLIWNFIIRYKKSQSYNEPNIDFKLETPFEKLINDANGSNLQ